MSLLTPGWVLLTNKGEKSTHSLHPSTLPSLLCPRRWLMEGLPPPILPPSSVLFDKQHKHLKRSRHFNHFLNRVFLCKAMQTCAISRETGPRIKNVSQKNKQNKSSQSSHITKYVHKSKSVFSRLFLGVESQRWAWALSENKNSFNWFLGCFNGKSVKLQAGSDFIFHLQERKENENLTIS